MTTDIDKQPCFVIFEGGGAKGITHLGALKALEEAGLTRIGAAGTSAGAIIAALTAVGYRADELFDPARQRNILADRGLGPIDLLGRADWQVFTSLRGGGDGPRPLLSRIRRRLLPATAGVLPPLLSIGLFLLTRTLGRPAASVACWRVLDSFGFFSSEGARDILNALLRERLERTLGRPVPALVRFRDLDPGCPLKIIATNYVDRSLKLFDRERTPDVVVADAVAASFSIPFFFKPSRVRSVVDDGDGVTRVDAIPYVDGGLVSNLPIWAFAEDKKIVERSAQNQNRRPIPIVAFTLREAAPVHPAGAAAPKPTGPLRALIAFATDVGMTGIFGAQTVVQSFIPHLTIVAMPTPLSVVQFDCSWTQALAAYDSGNAAAGTLLLRKFQIDPAGRREILGDILQTARHLCAACGIVGEPAEMQLRAAIVKELGNRSFKVVASLGMEGDADDDLVLDPSNPGAPAAFRDRRSVHVDMAADAIDLRMTKYERALVRKSLASIIAMPIFRSARDLTRDAAGREPPVAVLCLDSDRGLRRLHDDNTAMRSLMLAAVNLSGFVDGSGELP